MAWGESCQVKFDFYTKFLINMIGAVVVNMILLLLMYGHAVQPLMDAGCRPCSQLALTHFAPPFCLQFTVKTPPPNACKVVAVS